MRLGNVVAVLKAAGGQPTHLVALRAYVTDIAEFNSAGAAIGAAWGTTLGRHFPANPAKAMARMTLSYGVAQIFAPAMAGYIATATGSYQGALIVTAIVMVGGMGLLHALMNEEKRTARH